MKLQEHTKEIEAAESIKNQEDCPVPEDDQPIQNDGDYLLVEKEDSNSMVVEMNERVIIKILGEESKYLVFNC